MEEVMKGGCHEDGRVFKEGRRKRWLPRRQEGGDLLIGPKALLFCL